MIDLRTQNAPVKLWSIISKKFHQGALTIMIWFFFYDFCRRSIKPWKRWANFVKFKSLPILAIDCNKQWEKVQCLNIIIIYNSLSPLTEVSSVPGYCGSSGVSSVVGSALWSNIQSPLVHLKEKKYSFSTLL